MRVLAFFVTLILAAAPAVAQNLLDNPQFAQDPTVPGNGWETEGTGTFTWNQSSGDPATPSARTTQHSDEAMILFQCVEILGDMNYGFWSRSYTHASVGGASNGVRLSVFASSDCTGPAGRRLPACTSTGSRPASTWRRGG